MVIVRRADGRGPPVDLFQPAGSTALSAGDDHVDVSRAKLPDCPFSEELGDTEVNTQVHEVLAHGVDPNLGTSPVPLREGIGNPWVSLLGPSFSYMCQFWFLNICVFLNRVSDMFTVARRGSPYLRT
jgi:hypothetical protein